MKSSWGGQSWMKRRDQQLNEWFAGDKDALRFLQKVSEVGEVWDDITDQDKPLPQAKIDWAFYFLLTELPTDPFFAKHRAYLTPIMTNAITAWQTANILQEGSRNERAVAYTLRNMDIQIVTAIVHLLRGYAVAQKVSPDIWRLFAADQDDILDWCTGDDP